LFLMAGLPGAGKTLRAKSLAAERAALRLSPDAWMIPLSGEPKRAASQTCWTLPGPAA
jgi:predicted kinase